MRKLEVGNGQSAIVIGGSEVRVEAGAEARIVFKPAGDAKIELYAGEKSRVHCCMVSDTGATFALTNHVGPGAIVHSSFLWLSGAKASVSSILEGTGAEAYDIHAFISRDECELGLDTLLCHEAKGTKGDVLVKGVVGESASARLGGRIKVGKGGAGAESFLAEHVMLLGPEARASANPELEIENNDVSSRHAASVSQIDEAKLFYLMSRGVGREDASGLIVGGFLDSAIGKIGDGEWRGALMERARKALARP
ncbi:SufD family Fe-S cluster assembly protein [Candidatus Micrarchaeota archaeon]|nr:SufD family Fe-S cluster assembly protein [Candidatus Micrarchaeota archaeon]